jgi:murein L,D-transpeptidase YafK
MLTEEQIEKLSEEFKEKLRKGNTEKLNSFYDKESWVLEQGKSMEQKILEEVAAYKSKKKPARNATSR